MLESFSSEVIQYCENHTTRASEVLDKIEKSTHENARGSHMISGSYQGSLLRMISRMIRPEKILEIGTFTGYSAVCMAEGLTENGTLITLEIDESLQPLIEKHLSWSSYRDQIEVRYGRSEEHTSELQSRGHLVCRLLL